MMPATHGMPPVRNGFDLLLLAAQHINDQDQGAAAALAVIPDPPVVPGPAPIMPAPIVPAPAMPVAVMPALVARGHRVHDRGVLIEQALWTRLGYTDADLGASPATVLSSVVRKLTAEFGRPTALASASWLEAHFLGHILPILRAQAVQGNGMFRVCVHLIRSSAFFFDASQIARIAQLIVDTFVVVA